MSSQKVIAFLKFVARHPSYCKLLMPEVNHIDYTTLYRLALQHGVEISYEELRRAVRQFKRLTDGPFAPSDNTLI